MNDKELADKVVALGVGNNTHDLYAFGAYHVIGCAFSDFVRDWRVAGALMERMPDEVLIWRINYEDEDLEGGELISLQTGHAWVIEPTRTKDARQNESLPRAIIEACVEALDDPD